LDRAFLFAINGQMNELRFEIRVHPVTLQESPSDRDSFHCVVDAFRSHGDDLNTLSIPNVVRNGARYSGGIAFCSYFEGHYRNHMLLLLPPLLKNIPVVFIAWAPGAVNQWAFWPFDPSVGRVV